ncbi:Glutamate--cysteine ligase [Candidatus Providencia siddallii]|uniref:Glutamate--cysteine ligase n=1 Tax=Candidatus Providencia siddallii TaxID=1715285 RepID=A0A0M6W9M2_9GAMM|nr:Glutamate--cysteine ligase [Candidatus Providencia siddallii]
MFPNISKELLWLESRPEILNGIQRGIEREALRITKSGFISDTPHTEELGKALTHKWITTDFTESLLEFITPADNSIKNTLSFLRDLHRHASICLKNDRIWPLSIPCFIENEDKIIIAQYGTSNLGRFKSIYREGLKNRYGALMQTIAGVHYNFSLPIEFWNSKASIDNIKSGKEQISEGYLHLIRNYYRFGWIISYLFGASPVIWKSFIKNKNPMIFLNHKECYLPYATSLRISDFGYTNKSQNNLNITFNNLDSYILSVKKALSKSSSKFKKLGIKRNGKYIQLNTNILQIENELYTPIRPKRVLKNNDFMLEAFLNKGIEYVEVRSLDVNPFSAIGINETQASFIEIFLIWCAIAKTPKISNKEFNRCKQNWNFITTKGRKPDQTINYKNKNKSITNIGKQLFDDLARIAKVLDICYKTNLYQNTCHKLNLMIENPSLTYSSLVLNEILEKGINNYGLELSKKYFNQLINEKYEIITKEQFEKAKLDSIKKQNIMEQNEKKSFEEYLRTYTSRLT